MIKRIIGGKTYNTETATEIARDEDDVREQWDILYQTRFGAYFLAKRRWEYVEVMSQEDLVESLLPLSPEDARGWMEKNVAWNTELIEAHFGEMPEAGSAEDRFTLRMPSSLKRRIDALAQTKKQSVNAWVIRCLENCSSEQEGVLAKGGNR